MNLGKCDCPYCKYLSDPLIYLGAKIVNKFGGDVIELKSSVHAYDAVNQKYILLFKVNNTYYSEEYIKEHYYVVVEG